MSPDKRAVDFTAALAMMSRKMLSLSSSGYLVREALSHVEDAYVPSMDFQSNGSIRMIRGGVDLGTIVGRSMGNYALWNNVLFNGMMPLLSMKDLLELAQVDTFRRDCVSAFLQVDGPIWRVLRKFFKENIDGSSLNVFERVRTVLAQTSSLMSGSAVLAMLTNVLYEDADLDWIVDLPGRAGVVEFLQDEGFQSRDMWSGCKYYAEMNSVLSVWEFVRGEARVQVVTVDGTPFESVMAFHSTVVCNIFTSSSLVCMYAKETLMDKVNVAISADVSQPASVQALMKYAARGWSLKYAMVGMPDADRRTRFVGDSHCLVYHHGTCRDNIVGSNSWTEEVSMHKLLILKRMVSTVEHSYMVSHDVVKVFGSLFRSTSFSNTYGAMGALHRLLFADDECGKLLSEHKHGEGCSIHCELWDALEFFAPIVYVALGN